jgi:hypothetical protein
MAAVVSSVLHSSPTLPPLARFVVQKRRIPRKPSATAAAASPPTPTFSPRVAQVTVAICTVSRRLALDLVADAFKELPLASGSSVKQPRSERKLVCDGCGATSSTHATASAADKHAAAAAPADSDGALVERPGDLQGMFACLDRACRDLHLCKFCHLMGNWQTRTHAASHLMEPVAPRKPRRSASAASSSGSSSRHSSSSRSHRLTVETKSDQREGEPAFSLSKSASCILLSLLRIFAGV